jgi:hypothetical protein
VVNRFDATAMNMESAQSPVIAAFSIEQIYRIPAGMVCKLCSVCEGRVSIVARLVGRDEKRGGRRAGPDPPPRERPDRAPTGVARATLPPTGAPGGGSGAARAGTKSPIMSELAP